MKNRSLLQYSLLVIVISAVVFFLIHLYLMSFLKPVVEVKNAWWMIHVFFLIITLSGFALISRSHDRSQEVRAIGKSYLLYTTVKILLALIFIFPWLLGDKAIAKIFVGHFFSIFFPYLLVETTLLIRYLNGPMGEKSKSDENQIGK